MIEQLTKLEKRYEELEQLLGTQEVVADKETCNRYAKELSDLSGPVMLFRQYKNISKQAEDLEHVFKEKHDKEFLELAVSGRQKA